MCVLSFQQLFSLYLIDYDECNIENGGCDMVTKATCTNTVGSRKCQCNSGYDGDTGLLGNCNGNLFQFTIIIFSGYEFYSCMVIFPNSEHRFLVEDYLSSSRKVPHTERMSPFIFSDHGVPINGMFAPSFYVGL